MHGARIPRRASRMMPIALVSVVVAAALAGVLARRGERPAPAPLPAAAPIAGAEPTVLPVPAPPAQPVAVFSEREREFRAMLKAFREHVTRNSENVGQGFADEARKMHYGETEHRSIYGEANLAEAKELLEEGIQVHPLPILPDERN